MCWFVIVHVNVHLHVQQNFHIGLGMMDMLVIQLELSGCKRTSTEDVLHERLLRPFAIVQGSFFESYFILDG